jgi:antitoxin (DNA-binding transcriptional repressor) of toxin-antitoxin stability system
MNRITVEEVQQHLLEVLTRLHPGEGVEIVLENQVIGRLIAEASMARSPRKPGSAIGTFIILEEDDEHLQDFAEYMS